MLQHVVLSGGTCKLPGLVERVQRELGEGCKVQLAEDAKSPSAAWRGMSCWVQEMQHKQKDMLQQLENVVSYDDFSVKGMAVLDGLM